MANNNQSNNNNPEGHNQYQGATLSERAGDIKDRAGTLLQDGIDAVKANPGTTAAVIGGVAAAAAAFVARDKIVETASTLRDKATGSAKDDNKA